MNPAVDEALHLRSRRILARGLTYPRFLKWDGENQHVEWVDGTVISMPPVTGEQMDVALFLLCVLLPYVQHHDLGIIRTTPFQMKTGPCLPGRAPDLQFVSRQRSHCLRRMYLRGPADLTIEIMGDGSRTVDRREKFQEYEQGGVREHWLIDPERRLAEFYRRGRDARFHLIPVGADRIFRSTVLEGLWLDIDWLWQRPNPGLVLKAWGL